MPTVHARSKSPTPAQLKKLEVQAEKSKLAADAKQKKLDEAKAQKDAVGDDTTAEKTAEKTDDKKPVSWAELFKTVMLTSNMKTCWLLCAFALIATSVVFQPAKVWEALHWGLCMMSVWVVISFDENHPKWHIVVVTCSVMFLTGIVGVNMTTCYAGVDEMHKTLKGANAAKTFNLCRRAILADSKYMKENKEEAKKAAETLNDANWAFFYRK
jgi:hypothetical protein